MMQQLHFFLLFGCCEETSKTEVSQMPSAIEVHKAQVVFFWFFKVHPKSNENSRIVKFCGKLLKVYKKYQNNSWHIQIVASVGRSQKPRKSKMSQEGRRGKRYILAFPATRKAIKIPWLKMRKLEKRPPKKPNNEKLS